MSKTCSFIKAGAILGGTVIVTAAVAPLRSEEHTSELQSR